MNRTIKFRAWITKGATAGKYVYSDELGISFRFELDVIFIIDSYGDRYDLARDDVDEFIAVDKNGYDVYEGDKVIRIAGVDFVPEKTFPMSATFEDYAAINNGEIVFVEV